MEEEHFARDLAYYIRCCCLVLFCLSTHFEHYDGDVDMTQFLDCDTRRTDSTFPQFFFAIKSESVFHCLSPTDHHESVMLMLHFSLMPGIVPMLSP